MKRILHFQLMPLLSGPQNVMLHILEALNFEEYDIFVASQPGGPMVDEVIKRGYKYIPLPLLKHAISVLDIIVFIQLVIVFKKYKFDIVHTHSSKPGFLGRIAAKIAGVPLIIHTGHGAPFHDYQSAGTHRFYVELERIGALFCDRMVFVNNSIRLYYLAHKMIEPGKCKTIYNAVSKDTLSHIESLASLRRPHTDRVTIGSILRFSEAKNIIQTINVAIRICQKRKDVNFIFVGNGEYYGLCLQMVTTHRMLDRISLPGWQINTAEWLSKFDAFILYSIFEGLPMSIIEAMHFSLPVIGSDLPGIAELVDISNGWLISPNQPEKLEAELHLIIDTKDTFLQKGQISKMKVKELCSYDDFIKGYIALYEEDLS